MIKKNVLDLGCGNGNQSMMWSSLNFNVDAVDIRKQKIKNVNFIQKDIRDFKIKKNKYSIIIINFVFHYLEKEEALKILSEIKKNIKKNGYLFFKGLGIKDESFKNRIMMSKGIFETKDIEEIFKDNKIIELYNYSFEDQPHEGYNKFHEHKIVKAVIKF